MNKADLVEAIANATDLSKSKTDEVVGAMVATIIKAVSKGDSVQLVGFGTFGSGKRAARWPQSSHRRDHQNCCCKNREVYGRQGLQRRC